MLSLSKHLAFSFNDLYKAPPKTIAIPSKIEIFFPANLFPKRITQIIFYEKQILLVVIDHGLVKSRLQFEQTLGQFLFPNSHRKRYRVCCIGWSCGCIGFVRFLLSEYRHLNREEWCRHNYHIQWNRFRTNFPDKAHKLLDQKEKFLRLYIPELWGRIPRFLRTPDKADSLVNS
jgi:hypothetical protein